MPTLPNYQTTKQTTNTSAPRSLPFGDPLGPRSRSAVQATQQPTTNKESDRLQIIYQILAISSTILVGANAGVQLFHNLGQNL